MPFEDPAGARHEGVEQVPLSEVDIARAFQFGYDIRQEFLEQLVELQYFYDVAASDEQQLLQLEELRDAEVAFAELYDTYEATLDQMLAEQSTAGDVSLPLVQHAYALQQALDERFQQLRAQATQASSEDGVARTAAASTDVLPQTPLEGNIVGEGKRVELSPDYFFRLEQWEGVAERLSQQLRAVGRTREADAFMEQATVIGSTLRRFDVHTFPDHNGIVIDREEYPHEEQLAVERAVAFLQQEYQRLEAQAATLPSVAVESEATEMAQEEAVAETATETNTDVADASVNDENEDHTPEEGLATPAEWSEQLEVLNTYPYATTTERQLVRSMVENLTRQNTATATSAETATDTIAQLEQSLHEEIEHVLNGPSIDQLADRVAGILERAAPLQRREPAAYGEMQVVAQSINETLAEQAAQGLPPEQIAPAIVDQLSQQYHELEVLADTHRRKWLMVAGQYLPPAGPPGDRAARILRESLQVAWDRRGYSDKYPFLHRQPDVVHEMLALLEHIPPSGLSPEATERLEELALRIQVDQPIRLPGDGATQTSAEAIPETVSAEAGVETWTEADIELFDRLDHNPFVTPVERQTLTQLVTQAQELQEVRKPTADAVAASARAQVAEVLTQPDPTYLHERIQRVLSLTEPLQEYEPKAAMTLQTLRENVERVVAEVGASWDAPHLWDMALTERVRSLYQAIEGTAMDFEAGWLQVAGVRVPVAGSSWAEVVAFEREIAQTIQDPERHPELQTQQDTLRKIFAVLRHYENRGRPLSDEAAADLRDLAYELYIDEPLLEWVDDRVLVESEPASTWADSTSDVETSTDQQSSEPVRHTAEAAAETSATTATTAPAEEATPYEKTTTLPGLPRELASELKRIERRIHSQTVGFGYREDFPEGATLQFVRDLTTQQLLAFEQTPITQLRSELEARHVRPESFKAWVRQVSMMIQELRADISEFATVDDVFRRWYEQESAVNNSQ